MELPAGDRELVQIVDAALKDAAQRAGVWLACRPGCTTCCHGAFAINALDVARLRAALQRLRETNVEAAEAVETRARLWWAEWSGDFPGDRDTGTLHTTEEALHQFDDYANEAACPALDPESGLCAVYDGRPMTCRVFGPPVRMGAGEALGCCELCFAGATEAEIAACEMPVPHELEVSLLAGTEPAGETVVAWALLPASQKNLSSKRHPL